MIDTPFQVSLENDHKMRVFYVPELDSNALQVSESCGNPSVVVNRLMKSPVGVQEVCGTMRWRGSVLTCLSPVFSISVGMVPMVATDTWIISCQCVFHRVERLSGHFTSCQLSAFLKTSPWVSSKQRNSNSLTQLFLRGFATGATDVRFSLCPVPFSDSHSPARPERECHS